MKDAEITPLDLLLRAMRIKWRDGDVVGAVALARIAAPFVHPRPKPRPAPAAAPTTEQELRELTDAQLEALIISERASNPPGGPGVPD